MPKKKDLIKQIREIAKQNGRTARLKRQGSGHEIWECAGLIMPIPRHREIAEGTARKIIKRLEEQMGVSDAEAASAKKQRRSEAYERLLEAIEAVDEKDTP